MTVQSKIWCITLCILCVFTYGNAHPDVNSFKNLTLPQLDSMMHEQDLSKIEDQKQTLELYKSALIQKHSDSIAIFKEIALLNANLNNSHDAYIYAQKYIDNTLDYSIINDGAFQKVDSSLEIKQLKARYQPHIDWLDIFYFGIALIGFFLAIILNFTKQSDRIANALISSFIFIHSIFILEFALYATNLQLLVPNTYFMAGSTALLYGPLLYLYFKRVTEGYSLKPIDLINFLPNLLLIVFLIPIYTASTDDKIRMLLGLELPFKMFGRVVFVLKILSLSAYGFLIGRLHFKKTIDEIKSGQNNVGYWKRNIYFIHSAYILSYVIYGLTISGIFGHGSEIIYNMQVVAMSFMVLYVAFMAYVQPEMFSNKISSDSIRQNLFMPKYQNSGLTDTLSEELKDNLVRLFTEDKIYKDSTLNLESLSEKLNTTRHNASQVINEHFGVNFFELINKFRINEVISIFNEDVHGNLHIIDVAYEVGYNNKVTFNKAFKKETSLTPSQFIELNRKQNPVNLG